VRSGRKDEERETEGERKRNCSLFLFLAGGSECAEEAGCPGMLIFTVFRVRECRCWGQLNYYQGLEREEKQFKNAAFCCISFWPEYRNVGM
jgi:hypothetical protein